MTDKRKAALWLVLVYVFSISLYLPRLLELGGMAVPRVLAGLAGAFVLVPPLATLGFLLPAGKAKSHILENCRAFSPQEAVACLGIAVLGCLVSLAYALATEAHLFRDSYGSIGGLAASCVYLYATAFAEELAWRAFFLKSLAAGGKKAGSLLLAGMAWAFWHIPMWVARNGMGAKDIPFLLLWAVLVSFVLGWLYLRHGNLLSAALCHMFFNVSFLAPIQYNVAALFLCILAFWLLGRWAFRREKWKSP